MFFKRKKGTNSPGRPGILFKEKAEWNRVVFDVYKEMQKVDIDLNAEKPVSEKVTS